MLNLLAASDRAKAQGRDLIPKLFEAKLLNRAIIVKSRLQGDERLLFTPPRSQATRLIIPFGGRDLSVGSQTILIGRDGWASTLGEPGSDDGGFQRDVALLKLLDEAPSLDPFLLREHLRRYGRRPDLGYFSMSPSDLAAVEAYIAEQISPLIQLALKAQPHRTKAQIVRFSLALRSDDVCEALKPLRISLHLTVGEFQEAIYCWKGILYYKWRRSDVHDHLRQMLVDMDALSIVGPQSEKRAAVSSMIVRHVRELIGDMCREIDRIFQAYDAAFLDLVEKGRPVPFRDFLKNAPQLFMVLGQKLGAADHVASYWRCRFPPSEPRAISMDEYMEILEDFQVELSVFDGDLNAAM